MNFQRDALSRIALCLIAALMAPGCSKPPQVEPQQIRLVEATWTAVAGKDLKSLAMLTKTVEAERQSGRISPNQNAYFQKIFANAQNQRWQEAEEAAFEFLHAQGP